MGLGLAAALAKGISNIFVTAPTPENLSTFFEFCIKGLELLGFKQSLHFEVLRAPVERGERQAENKGSMESVTRINFFATHKQIVQYFDPVVGVNLLTAELLIIDEAAAIPLPIVKRLLGRCPVFISSTVHGYEGTGRSLSLKLVKQLRTASAHQEKAVGGEGNFREVKMEEPIRYSSNDPVEQWLYDLLLLDATKADALKAGLPHPSECQLYLVNKDTLFSYNKSAEKFLRRVYSLFVASHYKNSPNDLQLLSDAPAHSILVLLGNLDKTGASELPDVLCAVQVSLEGDISKDKVVEHSSRGLKPAGDLIPWTVSEQFVDRDFPKLNGLRVVRIAVHPQTQGQGYGSRALSLLQKFFARELVGEGDLVSFYEYNRYEEGGAVKELKAADDLRSKKKLKPLLKNLAEIDPPQMHYLGTSYGLTPELYRFWRKNHFEPVYLKQKPNELTAEFSCIMLHDLGLRQADDGINVSENWLQGYKADFEKRFSSLLAYQFRVFDLKTCMDVLSPRLTTGGQGNQQEDEMEQEGVAGASVVNRANIELLVSLNDLKRLESYSNNMIDFYLIRDLIPNVAKLFFLKHLSDHVRLSFSQCATLLGFGLQFREIEDVAVELNMEVGHCLALFTKSVKKISKSIREIYEKDVREEYDAYEKKVEMNPLKFSAASVNSRGKDEIKKIEKQTDSQVDKSLLDKREKKLKMREVVKKSNKHGRLGDGYALDVAPEEIDEAIVQKGVIGVVRK